MLPSPELGLIPFSMVDELQLLDRLTRLWRAMLVVDRTRFDLSTLITRLATACPTARIAVVDDRTAQNTKMYRQLRQHLPDVGCASGRSGPGEPNHRVIVSTYYGLAYEQLEHRDIIIVANAISAIGQRGHDVLEHAQRARLFGITDLNEALSPRERDLLVARFGLVRLRIASPGRQIVPIRTVLRRCGGGPRISGFDGVDLQRAALWRHAIRNRLVARMARELGRRPEPTNVAVLVENVEHATYLNRYLPGWPVVTGVGVHVRGMRRWQRDIVSGSRIDETTPHIIVTRAGLERIDIHRGHAVVRADGGLGLPFGDDVPVGRGHDVLLLVDLDDRHHPQLRLRSRQRCDAYLDAGWVPVADPMRALVDQFLRRRPRGQRRQ
jgi:hypothetical protein